MQGKYVNMHRLIAFVENSIDRDTQWVVFDPERDDPRLDAGTRLRARHRRGHSRDRRVRERAGESADRRRHE